MPTNNLQYLSELLKILEDRLSEEELRRFCFELGVDYDGDLKGQVWKAKALSLIEYLDRRDDIPQLINVGRRLRLDILWKDPPPPTVDLKSPILKALGERSRSHPDAPEMVLPELCEKIGLPFGDKERLGEVWDALASLEENGWVECQTSEDGSSETFQLTTKERQIPQEKSQLDCPATLNDFVQKHNHLAPTIQRKDILRQIKESFTRGHIIVLSGHPMVGKTIMLDLLAQELGVEYVPLKVTGQGLARLDNLDEFALDLADQLTNGCNNYLKHGGGSQRLSAPKLQNFTQGNGAQTFREHWAMLREIIDLTRQPVILFDEIERLLDYPGKLDPKTLSFLDNFIRSPENGNFILAGSERILFSKNKRFNKLLARGEAFQVRHYDDEVILKVFSELKKYFAYEDDVLQFCAALCDGHPRFLSTVFASVSDIVRSLEKRVLTKSDVERVLEDVIERTHYFLLDLCQSLSPNEFYVIWLVSRKTSGLISGEEEYTIQDLASLAKQNSDLTFGSFDLSRGADGLAKREWVKWKNKEKKETFRLRLGVVPLWIHQHGITPNKVGYQ